MKHLCILLFGVVLMSTACKSRIDQDQTTEALEKPENSSNKEQLSEAQVSFPVYDYEEFEPLLNKNDGKTYIVNFWATWCKPCIEEMPYFEKTYSEQKANGVELVLVSLDMPAMWKNRLEPFVEKKNLKGKVVILDDPKMNEWIPKVDENWGGGIPATLIYNKEKRAFFERGFSYEELNEELKKFL